MRATVLLLAMALCACQSDSSLDLAAQATTRIVLERSGCLGPCPVYRVEIGPDSVARYRAKDASHIHPLRNADGEVVLTHALTAAQYDAIWQRLHSRAFAELEPRYEAGVTDQQVTVLSLITPSGTRSITQDGAACLRDSRKPHARSASSPVWKHARFVPDVFCETVELIETASCADHWSLQTGRYFRNAPTPPPVPPRCRLPAPAAAAP